MGGIVRINQLPEGSGSLSSDDIFVFMDDPSNGGVTKKISLSQISASIGGSGSNPFDQSLNTTDFPTFSGISLSNNTTLAQGTFDNSTGGNSGISLNCYVGYELNWQGGHLKSTQDNGVTAANIYIDSPITVSGSITEGVVAIGNSSSSQVLSLTSGTIQTCTLDDNCTFTMPTGIAGQGFTLFLTQGTGAYSGIFTDVKWPGGTPSVVSTGNAATDIFSFLSDGTYWYGVSVKNFS